MKFGVAGPMTGDLKEFGDMIRKGSELAAAEINAAGGINGKKLELEFGDDQAKPDQAKIVAEKLANDPQILMVVGHFNSSCTLAGQTTYDRVGVVEFSPGSTNPTVCEKSKWTFRNLYRDDYQGKLLARVAREILGAKSVCVFYDNDDYGTGLKDAFVGEARAQGLEILGVEAYGRGTPDYSATLDVFNSKKPDVIMISGVYNEAATIIRQARSKGIKAQFLGGDGLKSPGLIDNAGDASEGLVLTSPFSIYAKGAKAETFRKAFFEKFGKDPDTWAALTYDAVMQGAAVVRVAGQDRSKIRDAMAAMDTKEKGYDGVTGITFFDRNRDCAKPAFVEIVKDGEFIPHDRQLE
ncbi:MAG: ABC transporter substrate-binding protein [Candidatus Brocadiae bacterium]|nr:ABC transporter substrate-binding protein [Candidatus Brocadiia bacterium]